MTSPYDHEPGFVGALIQGSLRFLRDLLDQIVSGIKHIVPVVAIGCQAAAPDPDDTTPAITHEVVAVAKPVEKPVEEAPKPIGDFSITFYYVVTEEEVVAKKKPVAANDNALVEGSDTTLASIAEDKTTLYES